MPLIEFPWTFPYRPDSQGSLAPLLRTQLLVADYQSDFLLLVDTGAEKTMLDGIHLRAAGMDIFSGQAITFQGFLGARAVAYRHRCRLVIGELSFEDDFAFSTQPLARQVLGRDVLAHLHLGLRERALEFYLAPETISG